MAVMVGYIVVLVAVIVGYIITGGALSALFQPFEFLILMGATIGACLASNTAHNLKAMLLAMCETLRSSHNNPQLAAELLSLLLIILTRARQEGMLALDIENSHLHNGLFQRYPRVYSHKILITCITDCLRLRLMGNLDERDIDMMMIMETDALEEEYTFPIDGITRLADTMPAFGIIAAVLGVIHALGSIDHSTYELSTLVSQAMVGTLLGILISYGFLAPLATRLRHEYEGSLRLMHCVRLVMLADMRGYAPQISVEFGRKSFYSDERPSFEEMEGIIRQSQYLERYGIESSLNG